MMDMGHVQGSLAQAQPIVVGKDTVYVHSNITPTDDGIYEYDEVQYTKDEYIALLAEQNNTLNNALIGIMTDVIPAIAGGDDNG